MGFRFRKKPKINKQAGPKAPVQENTPVSQASPIDFDNNQLDAEMARRKQLSELRKKQKVRKVTTLFILTLVSVFVVVLLIRNVVKKGTDRPMFRFVERDTIYQAIDSNVLIVRNETLITAPEDGLVKPLMIDGERVGVGQRVALMYKNDVSDLMKQIDDIDKQISERQSTLLNENEFLSAEAQANQTDEEIKQAIYDMQRMSVANNITDLPKSAVQIESILKERYKRVQDINFNDSVLDSLKRSKDTLVKSFENQADVVLTRQTGLVSYMADGMENTLKIENIENLDETNVKEILSSFSASNRYRSLSVDEKKKGEPIARVSKGLYQYFVFVVPKNQKEQFEDQTSVSFYLQEENVEIPFVRIIKKIPHADGFVIVARADKSVEQFLTTRTFRSQVRFKSVTGLYVPVSALKITEDKDSANVEYADLLLLIGGEARQIKVKVLSRDIKNAVIEPVDDAGLGVGSVIILNPGNIKHGDKVDG